MSMKERKVVLLGPPGAGKTSFFNKCTKPTVTISKQHISTTLIDTQRMSRTIGGDKVVEFELVDTVGSSIFGESGTGGNVFVGVRIVLCLFNINNRKSFEALVSSDRFGNLEYEIERRHGVMSRVDFILIGAQCDLAQRVDMEDIERFVNETTTTDPSTEKINFFRLDRKFFMCSSKTGDGINEILDFVAKTIASDDDLHKRKDEDDGTVRIMDEKTPQKSDCGC